MIPFDTVITVNYEVLGGSATQGTDVIITGTLQIGDILLGGSGAGIDESVANIRIPADNLVEGNETFRIRLLPGDGYTIEFWDFPLPNNPNADPAIGHYVIHDDPPVVSVSVVSDGYEVRSGPAQPAAFVVSRTGGDITQALTVGLAWPGTATRYQDFESVNSVSIEANSASAIVLADIYDDILVEPSELIECHIGGPNNTYIPLGHTLVPAQFTFAAARLFSNDALFIGIAGHTQGEPGGDREPGEDPPGILTLATKYRDQDRLGEAIGFSEDSGNNNPFWVGSCGSGGSNVIAYINQRAQPFLDQGELLPLVIGGFSHGASLTYGVLSHFEVDDSDAPFQLLHTFYIDAIRSTFPWFVAEDRRPPNTSVPHTNIFQNHGFLDLFDLRGTGMDRLEPFDFQINMDRPPPPGQTGNFFSHKTIDDRPEVHNLVLGRLRYSIVSAFS